MRTGGLVRVRRAVVGMGQRQGNSANLHHHHHRCQPGTGIHPSPHAGHPHAQGLRQLAGRFLRRFQKSLHEAVGRRLAGSLRNFQNRQLPEKRQRGMHFIRLLKAEIHFFLMTASHSLSLRLLTGELSISQGVRYAECL